MTLWKFGCVLMALSMLFVRGSENETEDFAETKERIDSCDMAIITCGNSGVGKSFIDNLILGREAFVHEYRARSVTRTTEVSYTTINGELTAVFNIPGLMEINKYNVEQNKLEIQKAFAGKPVQIVLSVFGVGDGGRIRSEDLATHFALQSAYDLQSASIIFIVNNVNPGNMNTEYQTDLALVLRESVTWPTDKDFSVVFAEQFPYKVDMFTHPGVLAFRAELMAAIDAATAYRHTQQHGIRITEDLVREADARLRGLISEMEALREKNQREIDILAAKLNEQIAVSVANAEKYRLDIAAAQEAFRQAMASLQEKSRRPRGNKASRFITGLVDLVGNL